jgi:hypothetical protein
LVDFVFDARSDVAAQRNGDLAVVWTDGTSAGDDSSGASIQGADGIQNLGEAGVAGVAVELLDAGGQTSVQTATNVDGFFVFPFVPTGTYSVRVDLPEGMRLTTPDQGLATWCSTRFPVAASWSATRSSTPAFS